MQLSIRDLTKLLDVTESLVTRWIKQRSLPAQQVGGQYRVNRAELLEWAMANNKAIVEAQHKISKAMMTALKAKPAKQKRAA